MAQTHVVSGTITDEEQLPIPGANVVIKGTTTGTITAGDGKFTMQASDGDVLQVSYIGYTTEEITVNGSGPYTVSLVPDMVGLSEVVVVGYGTQRKEAVTGSVASMKGDIVREMPAANITQSLQGRVAGVEMQQTSSKPGAEMQIRVRGTRSLNASNDPLVVLDGIPFAGSLSDINPNSIKSIDILKDASATAIYGSRGANGVIIVTSTKGNLNQDATATYSGYVGAKTVFSKYRMMNAEQLNKLREVYGYQYDNTVMESGGADTDWQDELYETGIVTNHDLGIVGGTKTSAYSFGAGYYKEESVLPGQDFTRISARASIDQNVGKYLRFGFTSSNNYSITHGDNYRGLYEVLTASPMVSTTDENGNSRRVIEMPEDKVWMYTRKTIQNAIESEDWVNKNTNFGTYNNFYGEFISPIEGLKYRINVGLSFKYSDAGTFVGKGVFSQNPESVNSASQSKSTTTNWAVEHLLTYDKTFGNHTVNAVALFSAEKQEYYRSNINATNLPNPYALYFDMAQAESSNKSIGQSYQDYGLRSMMARVMYSYADRYMLSVALRSDESSRLAKGNNKHTYPAISVGWNIAKENFMSNVDYINTLKLRVGYGVTSNESVPPYETLGLVTTQPAQMGTKEVAAYKLSKLKNPELGWEYSETMNYGIDFGLFDSRLTGSFEYYVQKTKDVLLDVDLPSTAGVDRIMKNIGETENKGFEFNLNGIILDDFNGLTWEAGFNMYANKNKLIALSTGVTENKANWWFVGHPINVIYDYEMIGLWQEEDDELRAIQQPSSKIGDIRVKGGYNEDGTPRKIDEQDKQIIEVDPKFQGGFNTRLSYKGFDLNIIGAYRVGGKLICTLYNNNGYMNLLTGRRNNVDVDYWTPENTSAKYPNPAGAKDQQQPLYGSTLGYFDASYCKIRTITLGYDFNTEEQNWADNIGIKKIRVYGTVQNPFVIASKFHKETGLDPETNSRGNENQASGAYQSRLLTIGTNTPQTRSFIIGLNVTF
ncbi:MAG: TonB-dependent receptor [Salinivirgaceae bacterium]|nr:TonB-dependent receptor [Salinivirgaceae bacterium]MBR4620958.1 TonB-dependent receptor [Salinivirgaceae bacterium]